MGGAPNVGSRDSRSTRHAGCTSGSRSNASIAASLVLQMIEDFSHGGHAGLTAKYIPGTAGLQIGLRSLRIESAMQSNASHVVIRKDHQEVL
jgi:hypothetical protein